MDDQAGRMDLARSNEVGSACERSRIRMHCHDNRPALNLLLVPDLEYCRMQIQLDLITLTLCYSVDNMPSH